MPAVTNGMIVVVISCLCLSPPVCLLDNSTCFLYLEQTVSRQEGVLASHQDTLQALELQKATNIYNTLNAKCAP